MEKRTKNRFLIAVGITVVAVGAVVLTQPRALPDNVPIPFLEGQDSSELAGSLTKIGVKRIGTTYVDIVEMTFPVGTNKEKAYVDKIYIIKTPNDAAVATVPFGNAVTIGDVSPINYYGYEYVSFDGATEISNKILADFSMRFPGKFFRSTAAAADTAVMSFFSTNALTAHGVLASDAPNVVYLKPNTRYVAIFNLTNPQNSLGADVRVRPDVLCGNNMPDPGEECDLGSANGGQFCSSTCEYVCGNGNLEMGEQCDDGNTNNVDMCSNTCQTQIPQSVCGNNILEIGEQCDDGNMMDGDGCTMTCQMGTMTVCGNGMLEPAGNEQCDDFNTVSGDGCSSTCQNEYCGDNIAQSARGELCDDGNAATGDGCSGSNPSYPGGQCKIESCGDNYLDPNGKDNVVGNTDDEECDDGNTNDSDECSNVCRLTQQIPL